MSKSNNKTKRTKSVDKVTINTYNVSNSNKELSKSCDAIKKSYKKIKDLKEELLKTWKGKASEKFDNKFEVLSDRYKDRIKPVTDNYIKSLDDIVEGYNEADKANSNVAMGFLDG